MARSRITAILMNATAALVLSGCAAAMPSPSSASVSQVAAPVPSDDVLSQMFIWWDQAFRTPGAFTEENFSRYFTPDATLDLNGRRSITGIGEWATRFQEIQAGGGEVEIVVPFKHVFRAGDTIYTYHIIRSRRAGQVSCMLAAGHATVRDGKIASIALVRSELAIEQRRQEPQCWQA